MQKRRGVRKVAAPGKILWQAKGEEAKCSNRRGLPSWLAVKCTSESDDCDTLRDLWRVGSVPAEAVGTCVLRRRRCTVRFASCIEVATLCSGSCVLPVKAADRRRGDRCRDGSTFDCMASLNGQMSGPSSRRPRTPSTRSFRIGVVMKHHTPAHDSRRTFKEETKGFLGLPDVRLCGSPDTLNRA